MPKFEMPKIDLPKIDVPKVDLPTFDLPEVPPVAAKPLYAGVGATDLAVEKVKGYVTEVQAKVQSSVKGFELPEPKSLQDKATTGLADRRSKFEARLVEFQAEAKALPTKVQTTVKSKYDENVATVTSAYADLAKRGETVVTRLRAAEAPAPAKAPATESTTTTAPAEPTTATKAPAKKAPAKKSTAKKSSTKKSSAK